MRLLDPNVELFLTDFIRVELTALADPRWDVDAGFISNREWQPPAANTNAPPPAWQVIVRDDGISDDELTVGITVLAGDVDNPDPAKQLAAIVKAIVKDCVRIDPTNPITAVLEFNGPYSVDDDSGVQARRYMNCTLGTVSTPLT